MQRGRIGWESQAGRQAEGISMPLHCSQPLGFQHHESPPNQPSVATGGVEVWKTLEQNIHSLHATDPFQLRHSLVLRNEVNSEGVHDIGMGPDTGIRPE